MHPFLYSGVVQDVGSKWHGEKIKSTIASIELIVDLPGGGFKLATYIHHGNRSSGVWKQAS